jgi:hypothetical protein
MAPINTSNSQQLANLASILDQGQCGSIRVTTPPPGNEATPRITGGRTSRRRTATAFSVIEQICLQNSLLYLSFNRILRLG